MSRTTRLFQLMQALRSLPSPATAQGLADELSVSPRTIYRDIETLRGLGAVIDGEAGFGYTLIEDAALPPLGFEAEELEALVLGLREVMVVGDPALAQAATAALAKLKARLPSAQANRLQHAVLTAQRWDRPPTPGIDARELRQAVWDERRIAFDYCDAEGAATQRDVDPLSIVYMQMSSCLIAWCHLRQDYRVFRLDRMNNLKVLDQSFRPNRVRMLRDYMEQLQQHDAHFASNG
ncbi:MAG: helix-turn-helix transcriptional regulator [Cognatishimia sp.]|uniref:helix-turn-helix transcriptional regulator n=1 Tax=Cognatishimia sp. TaxID=2211648 RepID=UPI004058D8B8